MDKADLIIDKLVEACAAIDPEIPVELDRRYDLSDDADSDEIPLIIITTGDEDMAPQASANQAIFDRRWVIRPVVNIVFEKPTSQQRAEISRLWAGFREQFKASGILDLLAHNTMPEMSKQVIRPEDDVHTVSLQIELGLTFERI